MQAALDQVEDWCKKWQVSLSVAKSKVIEFTRCPDHKSYNISLHLLGATLDVYEEAKFLGVTYDSRLTWESYFSQMTKNAAGKPQVSDLVVQLFSQNNFQIWMHSIHQRC
jgi:hypothetical protein